MKFLRVEDIMIDTFTSSLPTQRLKCGPGITAECIQRKIQCNTEMRDFLSNYLWPYTKYILSVDRSVLRLAFSQNPKNHSPQHPAMRITADLLRYGLQCFPCLTPTTAMTRVEQTVCGKKEIMKVNTKAWFHQSI